MCSGSEAGSYLRLLDFVYHSTIGLRVKKKDKEGFGVQNTVTQRVQGSGLRVQGFGFRV